jgi:alpha-galactosidase
LAEIERYPLATFEKAIVWSDGSVDCGSPSTSPDKSCLWATTADQPGESLKSDDGMVTLPTGVTSHKAEQESAARSPPMGWNSWDYFHCTVDESILLTTAKLLNSTGLAAAGYRYVNSDDCWMAMCRNPHLLNESAPHSKCDSYRGPQIPNPKKFPRGMQAVATDIHDLGLRFGLYTSASQLTCDGYAASCGFEEIDMQQWAQWGVDYVKEDACGICRPGGKIDDYAATQRAIAKTGRPMVLSIEGNPPFPIVADGRHGNSRRVGHDIQATWASMISLVDLGSGLWPYPHNGSRPGRKSWWNDFDIMEVGNGEFDPELGDANLQMARAHFTYWCILKSVLLLGNDLSQMSKQTLRVLSMLPAIEINQDSLGIPGRRIMSISPVNEPLVEGDATAMLSLCDAARPTQRWRFTSIGAGPTGHLWTEDAQGRAWYLGDMGEGYGPQNVRIGGQEGRRAPAVRVAVSAHTNASAYQWHVRPLNASSLLTLGQKGPAGTVEEDLLGFDQSFGGSGPLPHTRWLFHYHPPPVSNNYHWAFDKSASGGSAIRAANYSVVYDDDGVGTVANASGTKFCLDINRLGNIEVWHVPLNESRHAVAVINRTPSYAGAVTVTWSALKLNPTQKYGIQDVWGEQAMPAASGSVQVAVASRAVVLLILTPAALPLPIKTDDRAAESGATSSACLTWYDTATHGSIFRSVKDPRFGAKGDGVTDDTDALQAAIDFERGDVGAKRPAIVYLPPGRYLVSDTIVAWMATNLIGSFKCNSTIVLKASSPGFAERRKCSTVIKFPKHQSRVDLFPGHQPNDPCYLMKPVVAFMSGFNTRTSSHAWWSGYLNVSGSWCTPQNNSTQPLTCGTGFENNFFNHARNINIEVGGGNPAASGLLWGVAQQTSIRNVKIDLTASGLVGLDLSGDYDYKAFSEYGGGADMGGGGTIEDVDIDGGLVGMRASGSQWSFARISIRSARSVGLLLQHSGAPYRPGGAVWAFAVLALHVSDGPLAVSMAFNQATLFIDCIFALKQLPGRHSSSTAISLDNKSQVYLERVTHTGAVHLLRSPAHELQALPPNQAFYIGRAFDSGATLPISGLLATPERYATPLRPRVTFEETPSFINVLEHGCHGDWHSDDTECLQGAIDTSTTVFLPFGFYRISGTLRLRSDTQLVGEGLSRIVLSDHAVGFDDPDSPRPMLSTPDDADGSVILADLRLTSGAGNTGAVLLSWAVGVRSSIFDVHISVGSGPEGAGGEGVQGQGEVHTLFLLHSHGGGVFSNVHGWGADHNVSTDHGVSDGHAKYGVVGTSTGPATFFGCAFEHHTVSAFNLTDASNFTFYTLQTEGTAKAVVVNRSTGVVIYGTVNPTWLAAEALIYIDRTCGAVEIYGLNTNTGGPQLTKTQTMASVQGNASMDVPALQPSNKRIGNWSGRCNFGNCAMVARFSLLQQPPPSADPQQPQLLRAKTRRQHDFGIGAHGDQVVVHAGWFGWLPHRRDYVV